jgi:predicted RNA methylase
MLEVHKMLQLAKIGPNDLIYDLGCGDGRIIVVAAHYYGSRAIGIEIDPLRYVWCQILITILRLRDRVQVIFGDFFKTDLSDADVVTCYLLPTTNEKLESKFMQELQANTRIVSHDFIFPRLKLQQQDDEYNLYLYHP